MRFLLATIVVVAAILAGDAVWLGSTINTLYAPAMGSLMSPSVNLVAAAGFYLLYAAALSYIVILPNTAGRTTDWPGLMSRAALFGLAAYGTYNLTGLSVIRDWPMALSFIDMAWGAVITLISASLAAVVLRRLRPA